MRRKLAAGNWKMNGTGASLDEVAALAAAHPAPSVDILLCPPSTLLARMSAAAPAAIATGGQDCHANASGAHTGDISAEMLADAGAAYVILGHSERRQDHGERDAEVAAKAVAVSRAGLKPVICLGESLEEREAGRTLEVIDTQLTGSLPKGTTSATIIAYEPIWAIGTGKIPTLEQIAEMHDFIRTRLIDRFGGATGKAIRILYGGSVKPDNAAGIFAVPNVDGALVGGASLRAADFSPIITALEQA